MAVQIPLALWAKTAQRLTPGVHVGLKDANMIRSFITYLKEHLREV